MEVSSNLRIDISSIIKEPGSSLSFFEEGPSDMFLEGEDKVFLSVPISVQGVATSTGDGVYVQANASGVVRLTCSRCLREYDQKFQFSCEGKFQKVFVASVSSDENDDVEVFALQGTFCVLDDMIRHELILNLPMKPLCSPECEGVTGYDTSEHAIEEEELGEEPTLFGKKLLDAVEERSKEHGSTKKKDLGI